MKFLAVCLSIVAIAAAILTTGCETMQEHKIASGAIIGTATGAAAGAAIGGHKNRGEGALIGAAAGAALGTGIGYLLDRQARKFEQIQDVEVEKVPQETREPLPPAEPTETGRVEPLPTQPVPPHLTLRISSEVLFEKDSSALKADGVRKIDQIADILNEDPASRVVVKGFTSSEGSDAHNMSLSERRADVVKNQLIASGVDASRVKSLGFGESSPIADNNTEAGRVRNRRVEIEVIPQQEGRNGARE